VSLLGCARDLLIGTTARIMAFTCVLFSLSIAHLF
jgi:hypothetical protein